MPHAPIYTNRLPEGQPQSFMERASGSSSNTSSDDYSSPGPSTGTPVLESLLMNSKVFRFWHSRIDGCRIIVPSKLEHDGNSQRFICNGIERSNGKATEKSFFRCINPHAPGCSQVTASHGDMSRHQKTTDHLNLSPEEARCPNCGKGYSRPDSLKRHIAKSCKAAGKRKAY